MRILIVCPARTGTRHGNRVTALRWARILRSLGHRVAVHEAFRGRPPDLLIALHARKSAASALGFRARRPEAPLIVALTGTDVYRDIYRSRAARRVLEAAARAWSPRRSPAGFPWWRAAFPGRSACSARTTRAISRSATHAPSPASSGARNATRPSTRGSRGPAAGARAWSRQWPSGGPGRGSSAGS